MKDNSNFQTLKSSNQSRPPLREVWWVLLVFLLLQSCSVEVPQDVISEGRMEDILLDYHLAQAMAEQDRQGDVNAQRYLLTQAVFRKHGVTEAEFDSSMVWYSGHSEYLLKIYRRIDERMKLEAERAGLENQEVDAYAHLTAEGDTANVWGTDTHLTLLSAGGNNVFSYTIQCDTSYRAGDTFLWRFDQLMLSSTSHEAYALFSIEYDTDTVVCITNHLYGDGHTELRLPQGRGGLEGKTPRVLRCQVYLPSQDAMPQFHIALLRHLQLVRIHSDAPPVVPSLPVDTLSVDTLSVDTLVHQGDTASEHRMSPEEFRRSQKHLSKIHVTKEDPVRYVKRSPTGLRRKR